MDRAKWLVMAAAGTAAAVYLGRAVLRRALAGDASTSHPAPQAARKRMMRSPLPTDLLERVLVPTNLGASPDAHRQTRQELQARVAHDSALSPFLILQFNALADQLSEAFPLVDRAYLKWEHRFPLIVEEVTRFAPSIVCMEEIDRYSELAETLGEDGYDGIFLPKAPGRDGCALFVKRHRFQLVARKDVRFSEHIKWHETPKQVAILALLAPMADPSHEPSKTRLCVVVTHLKAGLQHEELRLREARVLLGEIDAFLAAHDAADAAVVIGGDFNTEPSGPVYKLMRTAFRSAYGEYSGGAEPEYTTWKIRPPKEFRRTIDYIWYKSATLTPLMLLSLPGVQSIPHPRLPSKQYPSDHLAIAAELAFK